MSPCSLALVWDCFGRGKLYLIVTEEIQYEKVLPAPSSLPKILSHVGSKLGVGVDDKFGIIYFSIKTEKVRMLI